MAMRPPDPVFVLRGCNGFVHSLTFMPSYLNHHRLVCGSSTGEIQLWNLKTRRLDETLLGHGKNAVIWVEVFDGKNLISQGRDHNVCVWLLEEGRHQVLQHLPVPSVNFCKSALSIKENGSHILATPTSDVAKIRLFHLEKGEPICNLEPNLSGSYGMAMCICWVSSYQLLIGYENGTIALWDIRNQGIVSETKLHSEPVMCIEFSSPMMKGISGSANTSLKLWCIDQTGFNLLKEHDLTNAGLSDIQLRRDDRIFATGGWDSKIRVFGFKKCKPLAVLDYHQESIMSLAFSPILSEFDDNQLLAVGSKDKRISMWSIYNT